MLPSGDMTAVLSVLAFNAAITSPGTAACDMPVTESSAANSIVRVVMMCFLSLSRSATFSSVSSTRTREPVFRPSCSSRLGFAQSGQIFPGGARSARPGSTRFPTVRDSGIDGHRWSAGDTRNPLQIIALEMVARDGPIRAANQDSAAARRVRIGQADPSQSDHRHADFQSVSSPSRIPMRTIRKLRRQYPLARVQAQNPGKTGASGT